MSHKRIGLIQHISYFSIVCFFNVLSLLPLAITRRLAVSVAAAAYYLVPRIKKIGMANLDIAYGDTLTREEKIHILRGSVTNLALVALEFPHVPKIRENFDAMKITVKGLEHVNINKGCVFAGAHIGNWEWLLPVGVHFGLRPVIIVRPFDDPRLDKLVDSVRKASGIKTVPKHAALGPLLHRLQEGWHAGLLADQNPREDAVPVTFFGQSTWATIGPAIIAMRSQTPIHPVCITRGENYAYTVEFFPALPLEVTGNTPVDLQTNTQRCQDALEEMIRQHPEQWLWFHRRWKKRDRLEQEWAARIAPKETDAAAANTTITNKQE